MSRTWQENSATINGLWPQCQWTDAEIELWRSDLSGLDQDLLFDALRNVKRSRDSLYPQLPWVLAAYRELDAARKAIAKRSKLEPVEKVKLDIDDREDAKLASEFTFAIEHAEPCEFENLRHMILDKLPRLKSVTAFRLIQYARRRLLGQEPRAGRVDSAGSVTPLLGGGASPVEKQAAMESMRQHAASRRGTEAAA
jgi:hypothetical protein